jgi:hypothetical protein
MDYCLTIAFGTFTGSTLQFSVKDSINAVEGELWKSFWLKEHPAYKQTFDKKGEAPDSDFSLLALDESVSHVRY